MSTENPMRTVSTPKYPRLVLFVSIASLMAFACGGSANAPSQTGPFKVGLLLPQTGNFAPNAKDELLGWNLALKDLGDTAAGRKIETVVVDDACDPTQGLNAARQLVENTGVEALFGPTCANEALAVRSYVATSGLPMLTISCADELGTSQKANNIFVSTGICDQHSLLFGKWVAENLHYKHITTIGLDFAYGWAVVGGFAAGFKSAGGSIDKTIWAPITAPDWAPYVTQVPKNTDAVFALTSGAATLKLTAAYKSFGLLGKIPFLASSTVTDYTILEQEDPEVAKQITVAGTYVDGLDTPENKKFAAAYKSATGKYPGLYAEGGYAAAQRLIAALKKVNGNTKDRKAFVDAVRSVTVNAPRGPVTFDASTNAPIQNVYISKVQVVNGELRNVAIATFKNVNPWGSLTREQWLKLACCYTRDNA